MTKSSAFRTRPSLAKFGVSAVGYLITAGMVWWSIKTGIAGHDASIWDRVGDEIRAGQSPYHTAPFNELFFYAPPWALAFALVSWLPTVVIAWAIGIIEFLAARMLAGSWLRLGYLGLCPLLGFELASAQWNLVIALSIAIAVSGDGRLAGWMAFAKLSPILAVRDLRRVALFVGVFVLLTVPVWYLWLDWARQLVSVSGVPVAPFGAIPYWVRLVAAIAVIGLFRTRLVRAIGAILAVPGFYWISFVTVAALIPELQGRTLRFPSIQLRARLDRRSPAARTKPDA